ncbi:uncharacterized protein LOC110985464 [Acanthaster planci]|uniref:Uncharacterized protein LOC110985464 n=1 Tax=Acanthaster planci TaxID=133434 RepID=A0A8B7Z950_ACAPL|nr:uncharacterized protein LOC110985464 [Acanthaster planci]
MSRSNSKACPKFRSNQNLMDDLGVFEEICTCNWRPGLVHRAGQIATPEFCTSTHQAWSTPLAGWFNSLPLGILRPSPPVSIDRGGRSSTPRKPATNNSKLARSGQTPTKPSTKSAGNQRAERNEAPFKHRQETSEYIKEYREKNVLRLVGSDGSRINDGNLAFGKTLPDPYAFKSEEFRKMYSRLREYLMKRPKRQHAAGVPLAEQHRFASPPSENTAEKEQPTSQFSISDEVRTNFSDIFSPTFQRPKVDMFFRPYICGSGSIQTPAKLRYSHSADRTGSLPSIHREPDAVQFPMPAYVVTESGNFYQEDKIGSSSKLGVATPMDLRLLEPKSASGSRQKSNRGKTKPNIMSAEFDTAMIQFLQKAKQNLERVREERIKKESLDKCRLMSRRGKKNDFVVTSGKQRTVKSNTTVTDVRRIKLGVSQS